MLILARQDEGRWADISDAVVSSLNYLQPSSLVSAELAALRQSSTLKERGYK